MRARWVVTGLALALGASGAARADGAFPDSDSIVVPASLPGEIVLGTNFGVLLSVDDGDTWTWTCEQAGNTFGSHYQMGAPPLNRLFTQARVGGGGPRARRRHGRRRLPRPDRRRARAGAGQPGGRRRHELRGLGVGRRRGHL